MKLPNNEIDQNQANTSSTSESIVTKVKFISQFKKCKLKNGGNNLGPKVDHYINEKIT